MHQVGLSAQRSWQTGAAAATRRGRRALTLHAIASRRAWAAVLLTSGSYASSATANGTAPAASMAISPVSTSSLMQVTLGLVAVLVLILALAWLARRFGPLQGGSGTVRLLGGVSLGQRERAVLVQVKDKQLLLGVAPGNVRTLHVFDAPAAPEPSQTNNDAADSSRPVRSGFAERLQLALSERSRR